MAPSLFAVFQLLPFLVCASTVSSHASSKAHPPSAGASHYLRLAKSLWLSTQTRCAGPGDAYGAFVDDYWRSANVLRAVDGTIVVAFSGGGNLQSLMRGSTTDHTVGTSPTSAADVFRQSFKLVPLAEGADSAQKCTNCKAGLAFVDQWATLRDGIFNLLGRRLKERTAPIAVTGGSVGGPLAMLCAAELAAKGLPQWRPKWLYTFGSTRAGNQAFTRHLEALFPGAFFSFAVVGDILTFMPPVAGFVPTGGTSMRYTLTGTKQTPNGTTHTYSQTRCEPSSADPACTVSTHSQWHRTMSYLKSKVIWFSGHSGVSVADLPKTGQSAEDILDHATRVNFWAFIQDALHIGNETNFMHYAGQYLRNYPHLGYPEHQFWTKCEKVMTKKEQTHKRASKQIDPRLSLSQEKLDALEAMLGEHKRVL